MNNLQRIIQVQNVSNARSDHNIVIAKIKKLGSVSSLQTVRKRDWKNFNETEFKKELNDVNWLAMKNIEDVNDQTSFLTSKVNRALDRPAPYKTFQQVLRLLWRLETVPGKLL